MRKTSFPEYKGKYSRLVDGKSQQEKEKMFLLKENIFVSSGERYSHIPGTPVAYWVSSAFIEAFSGTLLGEYAETKQGFATGNNELFLRLWFEVEKNNASIHPSFLMNFSL